MCVAEAVAKTSAVPVADQASRVAAAVGVSSSIPVGVISIVGVTELAAAGCRAARATHTTPAHIAPKDTTNAPIRHNNPIHDIPPAPGGCLS